MQSEMQAMPPGGGSLWMPDDGVLDRAAGARPGEACAPRGWGQRRLLRCLSAEGALGVSLPEVCDAVRAAFGATGAFVFIDDPRAPEGVRFAASGLGAAAASALLRTYVATGGVEPAAGAMRVPIATGRASYGSLFVFGGAGEAFGEDDRIFLLDIGTLIARRHEGDRLAALPACPLGYEENRRDCIYQARDLAESELRFRQLAENINQAIFLMDPGLAKLHYVSPAYETIWGRTRESLYADPWSFAEAIHAEDRARLGDMEEATRRGEWDDEYRVVRLDGSVRWVRSRGFPIRDASGRVFRVAGVAEDVTERRRAQEELCVTARRHRLLFEGSPLPLWVIDIETLRFLDVNEAACRKYGYSRSEFLSMTAADIRPAEDVGRLRAQVSSAPGNERPIGRWHHRLRDGREILVDISVQRLEMDGRRVAFVSPVDVTERVHAEAAVRESEAMLRLILDSTAEAIYGIDREGRCTFANRACAGLLGYEAVDQLIGRDMHALMHHSRTDGSAYPRSECRIFHAFRDCSGVHVDDEVFWRADGTSFPAEFWSYPIRRDGACIGSVVAFVDTSERRRAEEEVRRLNTDLERRVAERTAELRAANEELEAFDYSVAHDLRAPLARVRGFADALLHDEGIALSERGRDHAERIVNAARRMDDLVGDLLRLSLVSREKLRREKVDLRQVAVEVFEALRRTRPERVARLIVPQSLEATGDPMLLRVVMENLLGNAWKFTSKRADARIEVGRDGEAIFVSDNGAGFDAAKAAKLFTPFQRLHSQKDFEGTGIGLAIVHRIVHRHGGEVRAEGGVDRGATFRFTLSR